MNNQQPIIINSLLRFSIRCGYLKSLDDWDLESQSISRVLYTRKHDNHSSGKFVTESLKRPTRNHADTHVYVSYLVLLQVGFTLPSLLPVMRCALTGTISPLPFSRRYIFCGTFRRLSPPRRYLALCPMKPGLSSLFFNSAIVQPTF